VVPFLPCLHDFAANDSAVLLRRDPFNTLTAPARLEKPVDED
jgi:hypothetical protein